MKNKLGLANGSCAVDINRTEVALESNKWNLVFYKTHDEERQKLLKGTRYSVLFDESLQLTGRLNCNTFVTDYKSDGSNLIIEQINPVKKRCLIEGILNPEAYSHQNSFFINAISTVKTYFIEDAILIMTASDDSQLIFELD